MGTFSNGFGLMRQSWRVLRADKELVLFPIMSGIAGVVILCSFALPVALTIPWGELGQKNGGHIRMNVFYYLAIFSFYLVNFTVMHFFNSALAACVLERFRGGNPTLAFGFKTATTRLPHIVGWAVLSATVGLIIKGIQERVGLIGNIITAMIGIVWAIASYFVVPVLVAENIGPIDALKRSGQLMSKTWGVSLVSNMGMGLVGFGLGVLVILPLLAGIPLCIAATTESSGINGVMLGGGITCIVLSIIGMLMLALVMTTLKAILNTALYHFAVQGTAPAGFDDAMLRQAFRTKKKK